RLQQQAKNNPNAPALYTKEPGASGWSMTSYREYADLVRRAGKALIALGLGKGSTVSILGFNRAEWVILDVAAMSIGGAPTGIYTTCSPEEVQYIIHHAESPLVLLENTMQWEKIKKQSENLPLLKHVVMMKGAAVPDDPRAMSWEQFLAKGDAVDNAKFDEALAALEPDGLATLIYTSGTTGPPKGVMLSNHNLAWTAAASISLNEIGKGDSLLSYLPLSHIAEQVLSIHVPITCASAVYFAQSLEQMIENLKEVQPTLFFGVPRVWEKFHAGVSQKLGQATGVKKKIAEFAMRTGREMAAATCQGGQPSLGLSLRYKLAHKLVFSKLKPAIGLGKAKFCVSGAAPIAKEILDFFAGLDIIVREVYGQSEGTGPTSTNRPGKTKLGTVGPPYPGVEVKIAEDGEILVRGPNVFLGYFKEPEATAETLKDGWLCSGDLGEIDKDGYLVITGRKKEIIITAGGKNIAPKNIEGALKNHPLISEAVVIGDRRKFLSALISLDPEAARKFAEERGHKGAPQDLPALIAEVQKAVDEVNATLARVETVKKFRIVPRPFSIETGELTPTLKVKRKIVNKNFATEIESMYQE
ncbi:MAG TPA: long-chain fatty acid--CoA ligase, partial [Polyangiaceae bacterium]|nr:long-chain fatty acid--CoA ligase [Polyangiaceae bacterium]